MNILIVVTHLLGTGHLARAANLGKSCVARGHSVTLVSGGTPVPRIDLAGLEVVQLPPLRSDGVNFSRLLDENGDVASPDVLAKRADMLCDALLTAAPDVLVTELFPFGRRNLQDEFLTLLNAAKTLAPKPLVISSIRDILAPPSKPAKAALTDERIATFYDGVLVHSDPDITPLTISWPVSTQLQSKLHYTGFVAPPPATPHPDMVGQGEVIVSAGGGAVGQPIFDAALKAAALDPGRVWRLLVGGQDAADTSAAFAKAAPENAIIEPARPDFRNMLHHAAASVSMCGYNTALDLLQTGTPAVLVPFDAGGEVEQGLRAAALSDLDGVEIVKTDVLTAEALLRAVQRATSAPRRAPRKHGLDGATQTVRILETLIGETT